MGNVGTAQHRDSSRIARMSTTEFAKDESVMGVRVCANLISTAGVLNLAERSKKADTSFKIFHALCSNTLMRDLLSYENVGGSKFDPSSLLSYVDERYTFK
eukprot:Selendium_serpulae@DN8351_c0_g1_i1.p3